MNRRPQLSSSAPAGSGIAGLRRALARIDGQVRPVHDRLNTGHPGIDVALSGGVMRGRLHAVGAAEIDAGAATGVVAGLAAMLGQGRSVLWITAKPSGVRLHGAGLLAHGIDPGALLLLHAASAKAAAKAAEDGLRCAGLGAVVLALPARAATAVDLTAARRLQLVAGASGVTLLLLLVGDEAAMPRALGHVAETRWQVSAAPSAALAGDAPGRPAIMLELQRQRSGPAGHRWRVEWNRDVRAFEDAPLPGAADPFSADRSLASRPRDGTGWRAEGRWIAAGG